MGKLIIGIGGFGEEPKGYEGSMHDYQQDYRDAKRKGQSSEHYEGTAHDRVADKAGEKRGRDKTAKNEAIKNNPSYSPGQSHFNQPPKYSHGYGHKDSQRQGCLRCSGTSGAHRIGKK